MRDKIDLYGRYRWLAIVVCVFVGAAFSIGIYSLLGLRGDDNSIITTDMLRALKDFDAINVQLIKRKVVYRLVLYAMIVLAYLFKRYRLLKVIFTYMCVKIGFICTIFILEMKFIGAINYIFIVSPHEIIYVFVLASLLYRTYNEKRTKTINLKMYMDYFMLWSVAIFYETVIKTVFIRKILIIPKIK